jgi:hypothetical protein
MATVTLSFPGWKDVKVAPFTFRVLVTDPERQQP